LRDELQKLTDRLDKFEERVETAKKKAINEWNVEIWALSVIYFKFLVYTIKSFRKIKSHFLNKFNFAHDFIQKLSLHSILN
jgi:hypothetical protein